MRRLMGAVVFLVMSVTGATAARADALLESALAAADADASRPWVVIRSGIDFNPDGSIRQQMKAVYTAQAPEGQHWQIVSVNGAPPQGEVKRDMEAMYRANKAPPTYAMLRTMLAGTAIRTGDSATEARYRIDAMAAGTTMVKGIDLSRYLAADVIVEKNGGKPFVSKVLISAPKSFSPMFGCQVKSLSRELVFGLDGNGLPVFERHVMQADARAMIKTVKIRSQISFTQQLQPQLAAAASRTSLAAAH